MASKGVMSRTASAVLKKKKFELDFSDVLHVFIHKSCSYGAFVCSRGALILKDFKTLETYALQCPCGEDHVIFRRSAMKARAGIKCERINCEPLWEFSRQCISPLICALLAN